MPTNAETKIAIVTGASSGIGQATAIRVAERGARIVLTYNANHDGADRTVAAIRSNGGDAVALPLDVGRSESFAALAQSVASDLERRWQRTTFDYLVNNAGFGESAPFADTSEEVFDRLLRVHLKGPYFLTQRLLPLLADGGAIVNVTSNSAGIPDYSAYASMKAGLTALTRTLAKELSVRGIRVNAVAPGPTRTRISNDAFEQYPEVIPPLVEQTALGRLGESDDIGRAIAALLSDDCGWITAQSIEVSGGYML